MTQTFVMLFLFLGGTILTVGDIFIKEWTISRNIWMFVTGILIWIIPLFIIAYSYQYKNMGIATMIFCVSNLLTLTIISYFRYGEKLDMFSLIGFVLGIAAICLFQLGGK